MPGLNLAGKNFVRELPSCVDRLAASKARQDTNDTSIALKRHAAASARLRGLQASDSVSIPPCDQEDSYLSILWLC